jgi:hypothetical protein
VLNITEVINATNIIAGRLKLCHTHCILHRQYILRNLRSFQLIQLSSYSWLTVWISVQIDLAVCRQEERWESVNSKTSELLHDWNPWNGNGSTTASCAFNVARSDCSLSFFSWICRFRWSRLRSFLWAVRRKLSAWMSHDYEFTSYSEIFK